MKMCIGLFVAMLVVLFSQAVIAEPEMVFVKGGCFEMGDTFSEGNDDEEPVHEVCLNDFYIGKYEVTQREWVDIIGTNPSAVKSCDDCPVEHVNFDDVNKFIKKLRMKTGKKYRLPTEAEWEYAARSRGKNEKWAGTSDISKLKEYAWHNGYGGGEDYTARTHSVGQKKPNELGLYDMSGNVWEWVQDIYQENYYKKRSKNNPKGPSFGLYRVLRGGSWDNSPWYLRSSYRGKNSPYTSLDLIGFRIALSDN